MDQERERIQADLRGLLDGEVRCDDVFLQLYASDASIYQIRPLGVVRPRGASDVIACVRYAAQNGIPIHARGAGTGLSGESLGAGLVVDFSYMMRRILASDQDTVTIQPGVVHAQLNRFLHDKGSLFGPDPATGTVSTMGGVLSLDGSGSHWLKYGSARNRIVSMQVVLADGSLIRAEPVSIAHDDDPRRHSLVGQLSALVEREQTTIADNQPRALVNRSGYHLTDILADGQMDLARLLVGSEGTLALITEATLRIDPLPRHYGVALLFFDRLESAARGSLEIAGSDITACDMMDRRLLSIARESDVRYDLLIPTQAEAMLLVEQQGDSVAEVRSALEQIIVRLQRKKRLAFDSRMTVEPDELSLFWRLANHVVPSLYRLKGTTRPLPFVEDIAVPPAALPEFLITLQNVLKNHQVTASLFGHAGHGQLHIRPFLDLADPSSGTVLRNLAADLYEQALAIGGTISGEHGVGLSRTWFLEKQYGALYPVFRAVKQIFDPQNIFNPGKVVAELPPSPSDNLRAVSARSAGPPASLSADPIEKLAPAEFKPVDLQLTWTSDEMAYAARNCNGCGRCRTQLPDERMCPIFRYAPREEATPRAKANLMRAVLTGTLDSDEMARDAVKSIADLCVNCHQCRVECPASVDIPKLMMECKAQYVATNGLRPSDRFLARMDRVAALGSRLATLSNFALSNRQMRWLIEKLFGIAQGRKLPRFAARSFLRQAARRRLNRPTRGTERKVLYFVDHYANWHDVQLAEAFVEVMEHNGISVYVPPGQLSSAMPSISMGALDQARRIARHNVDLLAEAVRQGYDIVATEPAAALCLSHEYPLLLDDDEARLVGSHSFEACAYLWKMHQNGRLELDLKPIHATLGYHEPCHMRVLDGGNPGYHLMRLIPGLSIHRIDEGCSGMAGTFGLKRENYRTSLRAGWGLISALRGQAVQLGTTQCSACKIQMEQGTTKPTIHPLKILAHSYGRLPDLAKKMTDRGHDLLVT